MGDLSPDAQVKGSSGRSETALICSKSSANVSADVASNIMAQKYSEQPVTAAGGWVENSFREVLWIHRLGQWDLPKGKLEPGEAIEACAVREVEEECGIGGIVLESKLCETQHRYEMKGVAYVKTTHWFRMYVEGRPALTPQAEEGIDDVRWMSEEEWREAAKDTYVTIQEVMRTALGTKSV